MKHTDLSTKRIAIVCDWLTNQGGAEHVVWELHQALPTAPIYTSVYNAEKLPQFGRIDVRTSFMQHLPFAKTRHQLYLLAYPYAFEQFDLDEYDIVISSSHSVAKGVITKPETVHICYCHCPMRYAWDGSQRYIAQSSFPWIVKKTFIPHAMRRMRIWDRLSADRVDYFLANSSHTARRIKKYYERKSDVVYPPVYTEKFHISKNVEDYFLAVGRLIPYKRFDLLVETFNDLGLPLLIVGTGPELSKLRSMAKNNIEFVGFVSDMELSDLYAECQALVFPQEEDFGIIPIEAMASGRPVIAYGRGGALETIVDGETGVLFHEQTKESLMTAIKKFHPKKFSARAIKNHAEQFNASRFREQMVKRVSECYEEWQRTLQKL